MGSEKWKWRMLLLPAITFKTLTQNLSSEQEENKAELCHVWFIFYSMCYIFQHILMCVFSILLCYIFSNKLYMESSWKFSWKERRPKSVVLRARATETVEDQYFNTLKGNNRKYCQEIMGNNCSYYREEMVWKQREVKH